MTARNVLGAAALAAAAGMMAFSAPQSARKTWEWSREPGRALALHHEGAPLWIFHFDPREDWPYIHPVRLPGGPVMTGLSPKDHPWHRALWFSWKYIAGTNFWEFKDLKDPASEPAGRTERAGPEEVRMTEKGVAVRMVVEYRVGAEVLVREKRTVAVELPRPDGSYAIDWEGTFETAGRPEVELGKDTGYAGLFFRAAPDWKRPKYLDSEGLTGTAVHQAPATWIDMSSTVDPAFGPMGVALFGHPANPRHPSPWWRDRSADDDEIAYIGTGLLFGGPIVLKDGAPLTLRYRVLVHKGEWTREALEAEYQDFAARR